MLDLPILNVRLSACPEDWQQMPPTPQGRRCSSCDREVVNFTAATQTDLDAARAAAPDGRLCGRFRTEQVAPPPRLRPQLRQFVVALVLVCGLGLTSGEAWAQVRKATAAAKKSTPAQTATVVSNDLTGIVMEPIPSQKASVVYTYVEQMPTFPGGQEATRAFLQKHLQWPKGAATEGRVFVNFIVGSGGKLREFKVVKGVHPLLDAEALRVARLLDGHFSAGKQNGRTVDVFLTLPITFSRP